MTVRRPRSISSTQKLTNSLSRPPDRDANLPDATAQCIRLSPRSDSMLPTSTARRGRRAELVQFSLARSGETVALGGLNASAAASRVGRRNCALPVRTLRSRGRSTAGSSLVRSRPAPPLLTRSSRIVVTVIAARRTFTAQFVKCETGRPLRLAAPDAVQPLHAAVVPDDGGR